MPSAQLQTDHQPESCDGDPRGAARPASSARPARGHACGLRPLRQHIPLDGAPIQYTGQVPELQKNILCRQCSTQKTLLCLHYSRNDLHFHRRRFNGWHSGLRQALPRYLCVLGLGVSPGPHLSGTSLLLGND